MTGSPLEIIDIQGRQIHVTGNETGKKLPLSLFATEFRKTSAERMNYYLRKGMVDYSERILMLKTHINRSRNRKATAHKRRLERLQVTEEILGQCLLETFNSDTKQRSNLRARERNSIKLAEESKTKLMHEDEKRIELAHTKIRMQNQENYGKNELISLLTGSLLSKEILELLRMGEFQGVLMLLRFVCHFILKSINIIRQSKVEFLNSETCRNLQTGIAMSSWYELCIHNMHFSETYLQRY